MGTTLLHHIAGALRSTQRALSFPVRNSSVGVPERAPLLAAAAALVAVAAACGGGDGLTSPANSPNVVRSYSVYALSGSSTALPAAYQFTSEALVRPQILPSGAVNFDVAFDIAPDGRVRVMPVRAVVPNAPQGSPSIGVLRLTGAFGSIGRAPDRGYAYDSVAVLAVGETIGFEITSAPCVYGEPYYAKLAVDSVILAERRIVFSSLVNRNCGYRALTEGLPKN
ncbi:MAG TPA: hypothetical protein VE869_10810 [Gemmatimonas sp.]|nr:hypothetical protein [Gemmatimonas sp.]